MRSFIFALNLVCALSFNALAQARRVSPRSVPSSTPIEKTAPVNAENSNAALADAARMYDEAKDYAKNKFEEFKIKKLPYSDDLREQTLREQKQLAARYALQLAATNPAGENLYFLGMLNIVATNDDNAADAFKKYLLGTDLNGENAQTARSFLAVTAARRKDFATAENALAEYLKGTPVKTRERLAVERELAKQYQADKNLQKAVLHGENALTAARLALRNRASDDRLLEVTAELGKILVDVYSEIKADEKISPVLETLRDTAVTAQNTRLYLDSTDKIVTTLIERGQKPEALKRFRLEQSQINANFHDLTVRAQIKEKMNVREKQLQLLNEAAPEFDAIQWIDEKGAAASQPLTLANMRGKVVLIDFWATWCKPCFDQFPELTEWHQTYQKDGLEVIGYTRYYGQAGGFSADEQSEFAFLQKFKREQRLPYKFAVSKSSATHRAFYSYALPTVALIDKKGILRFVETGTNTANEELERLIQKLLAE